MSDSARIKELRKEIKSLCGNCDRPDKEELSKIILSSMALGFSVGLEAPSADRPQGEWIPCSKKMPNEGDRIVVQYADGSLGLINSCRMRIWNIPNSPYSKVVAWMYIEPWISADDEIL